MYCKSKHDPSKFQNSEAYSEPCQTSKMKRFANIFSRCSIFDRVLNAPHKYGSYSELIMNHNKACHSAAVILAQVQN